MVEHGRCIGNFRFIGVGRIPSTFDDKEVCVAIPYLEHICSQIKWHDPEGYLALQPDLNRFY